jgi:hypothetical protein
VRVEVTDRPLEAVREEVVERLITNYGRGELSLEAFERRLDQAMDASCHEALLRLAEDLPLQADNGYAERKQQELGIRYHPGDAEEAGYLFDVLSTTNRKGEWDVPKRLHIFNVLGNNEIDFTEARFYTGATRISVFSVLGTTKICVTPGMSVTASTLNILGSLHNKAPANRDPDAHQLVVEGFSLLGSITIKQPRPFKGRLLEWANSLRAMFVPTR